MGRWVTMRGRHVYIRDSGDVETGARAFKAAKQEGTTPKTASGAKSGGKTTPTRKEGK